MEERQKRCCAHLGIERPDNEVHRPARHDEIADNGPPCQRIEDAPVDPVRSLRALGWIGAGKCGEVDGRPAYEEQFGEADDPDDRNEVGGIEPKDAPDHEGYEFAAGLTATARGIKGAADDHAADHEEYSHRYFGVDQPTADPNNDGAHCLQFEQRTEREAGFGEQYIAHRMHHSHAERCESTDGFDTG